VTFGRRASVGGGLMAATLLTAACSPLPERDSCAQVVGGTWRVAAPAAAAGRDWAIDDRGAKLELFALSRPGAVATELGEPTLPPGTLAAPTAISLERSTTTGGKLLTGTARRRFTRGAASCVVKVPARIEGCTTGALTLHLPTITPPADFAACPTDADASAAPIAYTLHQTAAAR
jgi:hypothetical protein